MQRKKVVLPALIVILVVSGIGNIILIYDINSSQPVVAPPDFVIGTLGGLDTLELVDVWDSDTKDVLYQVVETLFSHDLYDLDLPRINKLASSYWWENNTVLHVQLREGIIFHDGTPFNATAVKWNLDRLQYLVNATGTNFGEVAFTQELWMFPDGITPIMDTITVISEFNITITLNAPYGPFLNTLTYINAGMISPSAHAEDETSFIDLTNSDIIGTGPYMYDYFTPGKEVILSRWEGYWKNLPHFKKIKFAIFDDLGDLNTAMFSHSIDYQLVIDPYVVTTLCDTHFCIDTSITIKRFTWDTGIPSLVYHYLNFNNNKLNVTWRKALSHAINYSYILEELRLNYAIRANSPISPGFGLSYNNSVKGANYNLTKAREIIFSMGFGNMGWSDNEWIAVAEGTSPFREVGYFFGPFGPFLNQFREDLGLGLLDWFKLIGVQLYEAAPCFPMDTFCLFPDYDKFDLYTIGWGPDYFSPFNMLHPIFNPHSIYNIAQVNDTTLNAMIALALNTVDDTARYEIYKNIQWYVSEVGFFHAYLYHNKINFIHSADLYGVPYNAMQQLEVYGIRRA